MAKNQFPSAPFDWKGAPTEWLRKLASVLNGAMRGSLNNSGDVTLTASATTTTITDSRITADSVILLMPTTANAAGALATTYITPGVGSATITHANAGSTDRSFSYILIG